MTAAQSVQISFHIDCCASQAAWLSGGVPARRFGERCEPNFLTNLSPSLAGEGAGDEVRMPHSPLADCGVSHCVDNYAASTRHDVD